MKRLRQRRHQLLARAVLVPADVGHEHRVFRRHARDLVQQARRMDRLAGVALLRRRAPAATPPSASRRSAARAAFGRGARPAETRGEIAQRRLRVADQADVDRIDLADLLRVDVDLDQPRSAGSRRCSSDSTSCSPPRRRSVPTARIDVGAPREIVRDARAPDAGHADRQRVILGKDALAISVVATGAPRSSATCAQLAAAPPTG